MKSLFPFPPWKALRSRPTARLGSRSPDNCAVRIRLCPIGLTLLTAGALSAAELRYEASDPPLEITFAVAGGHYSGMVHPGCLFLQSDIGTTPVVRWEKAEPGALYTLLMLDFDGNANGSWPDRVPSGDNAPVRHWIVGNIPGDRLRVTGYVEDLEARGPGQPSVLQPYRAPHIPMVSDRYGIYLFRQKGALDFGAVTGPITNFDHRAFLNKYGFSTPEAANWFVAVFTSESPFSGKPFQGNDVSALWHRNLGSGELTPAGPPPAP